MRHNKKINHLGRTSSHRKAMLSNMAASLIMHKKIVTTLAKAKALRMYIEPLLTKAKEDTTHNRRTVFSYLQNKFAVAELFRDIAAKIADRPGGYTRILKTGNRLGDNAEMCIIELVDYNETLLKSKDGKKTKSTRRRGGKKSATPTANVPETKAPAETIVDEVQTVVEENTTEDILENVEPVSNETEASVENNLQEDKQTEEESDTDEKK